MEYLAGRKIGLLGRDGNNDTAPSAVPGVDLPVHVLAIAALGVHDMAAAFMQYGPVLEWRV
jgi:hypothetical protein